MDSRYFTVALVLCPFLLLASGCDSLIDTLFGRSVPVDAGDLTAPSVRILIADVYVKQPIAGDLKIESDQRFAQVEPFINVTVVGYDPEGVRFVELSDIEIQPFCGLRPLDDDREKNAPEPDYQAYPPLTVPGERIALPEGVKTATTRITLVKPLHITDGLGEPSPYCPGERRYLGNAVVRLTAQAGNFGGGHRATGTAVLSLRQISSSQGLASSRYDTGDSEAAN